MAGAPPDPARLFFKRRGGGARVRFRYECWRRRLFGGAGLQLDVVFEADPVDQTELRLYKIDVLFLAFEDMDKQITRYEIAYALAIDDRVAQPHERRLLKPQIAVEQFAH